MSKVRSVAVALVFLVGCAVGGAAGRFVVPPASAQQVAAGLTRWEYSCFVEPDEEAGVTKANELGREGWEMLGLGSSGGANLKWCFKRRLP